MKSFNRLFCTLGVCLSLAFVDLKALEQEETLQEAEKKKVENGGELPNQEDLEKSLEVKKKSTYKKILEKERELQVPRESVPVTESKYLIQTPIPKTAHYLPFLQTLLNIQPGTLPNPIGISIIGSYTHERYKVTEFNGTMGDNMASTLCADLSMVPSNLQSIMKALCASSSGKNLINNIVGAGETKKWDLSEGIVDVKTAAVGVKADMYLFPFMNVFVTTAYLSVEQSTNVGIATINTNATQATLPSIIPGIPPTSIPIPSFSMSFPVGTISNKLDGFLVMGGTNLAIGYKGFFLSCMVAAGYVRLDDLKNNIKGFVQKPYMYIAPRVGYTYNGIFTIHTGVQRIQLFGDTKGTDLSEITGGLVAGYSTKINKFPVTFLAGAQFMFMRDLGLSIEYVGSPDTNGINAELVYRF